MYSKGKGNDGKVEENVYSRFMVMVMVMFRIRDAWLSNEKKKRGYPQGETTVEVKEQ